MIKSESAKRHDKVKLMNEITAAQYFSDERRKKNAIKFRSHNKFFNAGVQWYIAGNQLEDGLNNGEQFNFQTKENIDSFKQGFNYLKYEEIGFQFGIIGTAYEELPSEFLGFDIDDKIINQRNDRFKCGYRHGLGVYYGLNTRLDQIPQEYQKDKIFLDGFKEGLEKLQTLENNSNRTK